MRMIIALSLAVFASSAHAQQDFSATIVETLEEPEQIPDTSAPIKRSPARPSQVWYAGCDQVRLLGRAPLYRGQPGYREGMDSDGDGVACEPYLGAVAGAAYRESRRAYQRKRTR